MYDQAISGIKASELRMEASTHNTADISTENARSLRVQQRSRPKQAGVQADMVITNTPPDLITESVEQIYTPASLRAAVATAHTQDQMQQEVIDLFEGVPESSGL